MRLSPAMKARQRAIEECCSILVNYDCEKHRLPASAHNAINAALGLIRGLNPHLPCYTAEEIRDADEEAARIYNAIRHISVTQP
jgi:hypothetical protein